MFWRVTPFVLTAIAAVAGVRSQAPNDSELIRAGLAAWQKQDAKGRACVSCHSPQGLELAFYGFSDADIVRRAEAHVDPSGAQAILAMIQARRREYKIDAPLDPMTVRPLQPGGAVLPGATPAERDYAFAREIDALAPLMTRGSVDSIAKAREAKAEIIGIDLAKLKVGFEFNRLSEDGFHGSEHAAIADWIPDTPVKLSPATLAARNAYMSDPSDGNLKELLAALPPGFMQGPICDALSMIKYRSLLHLQAHLAHPNGNELKPALPVEGPFWDMAEFARGAEYLPLSGLGFPDDIRAKKEPGPSLKEQFKSMRLPWYWMSWISDPGLQHTRLGHKDRRADYFGFSLFGDGPYPTHCAFMYLRKQLTVSFDPAAWNSIGKQHFELQYSAFLLNQNFKIFAPKAPEQLALYNRFVVNEFRTSLYLLLDDTRATHLTDAPFIELSFARRMANFIESEQPASKNSIEQLLTKISAEFDKAKHTET